LGHIRGLSAYEKEYAIQCALCAHRFPDRLCKASLLFFLATHFDFFFPNAFKTDMMNL